MSSALTAIADLSAELEDPGVVSTLQKHLADGCPLAPLVEAVTPDYAPEDRPRLIAAMVERARAVIAHQNEAHADDAGSGFLHNEDKPSKGGRPKSPERAVRKLAASMAKVSEETVRRHQKAMEPDHEPPVAPAKPVRIETLINEFADKLADLAREGDALLPKALAEPGQATGATWRGSLRLSIGRLSQECACLRTVADDIVRGRGGLARVDAASRKGERATKFDDKGKEERIAKGGGLRAPARPKKQVQVVDEAGQSLLPSTEEIAATWAEGAKTFGPDDGEDAF